MEVYSTEEGETVELLEDRDIIITHAPQIFISVAHADEVPRNTKYPSRTRNGVQMRLGGSTVYTVGERVYRTQKNDVLFLPCGLQYSIHTPEAGECIEVSFLTEKEYTPKEYLFHLPNCQELREILYRGLRATRSTAISARSERFEVAYQAIGILQKYMETEYKSSRQKKLLSPAEEYLASCRGEELNAVTVGALAELCGIGETYFRELCGAVWGKSPVEYLRVYRIGIAKAALSAGESIRAAAFAAGYDDVSYFTKVFRRETGMTPREYRLTLSEAYRV